MKAFPTALAETQTPISEYPLSDAGLAAVDMLAERGLEMVSGIREADLDDILEFAATDAVKEYCPNDVARFSDGARRWAGKGRGGFILRTIDEHEFRGHTWMGVEACEELPNHPVTTAYRTMAKGTGALIVVATVEAGRAIYELDKGCGLETWASNGRAVSTYTKVDARLEKVLSEERNKKTDRLEPVTRPTLETGDHVFWKNGVPVRTDTRMFMSLPEEFPDLSRAA